MEEWYKVLWLSKTSKTLKSFVWDEFVDDPQNKRSVFSNTITLNVLTLHYDDTAWSITAPYKPIQDDE